MIRQDIDWVELSKQFQNAQPFNHVAIDNFFLPEVADAISEEFPDYNDPSLDFYDNPLENKKAFNNWDKFKKHTYQAFTFLARENFTSHLSDFVQEDVWMDYGLNGGGYHLHGKGGNLNVHLDYNIHPKLGEQRKLNIIIYMAKNWNPEWGGGLELWTHDEETNQPKELYKVVDNVYNRAVIFDTTQNSWHGLPKHLKCPDGMYRKSLAAYYVRKAPVETNDRMKALFAPREEQKNNQSIKDLILKRVGQNSYSQVYRVKDSE